jgi:GGDEF domain-containing protein
MEGNVSVDVVAVGFWGAFFGAVSLALAAAWLAFTRSAHRVALTGSLAAALSCLYVLVYLGWLPVDDAELLMRLQAHAAALCAGILGLLLFRLLGLMRNRQRARRTIAAIAALMAAAIGAGWLLPPEGALALGALTEVLIIPLAFTRSLRAALRGNRPGWLAVAGVGSMSVAVTGLTWFAFRPDAMPWPAHAVSAVAAMGYLSCMAAAMWVRYAYLIDVREVMVHGPSFDPVTRMRSHVETDAMVTEAFARSAKDGTPVGVLVVSIGNLSALEQLHGRSAYNHGLFICASRLRRVAPPGVELGRLSEDGFLLVVRRPDGPDPLMDLAHQIVKRLMRAVALGTSQDIAALETSRTDWVADVGVGLLMAKSTMRPGTAVAGAQAMSRTAWSYATRVAWYDEQERQIAELPVLATAAR